MGKERSLPGNSLLRKMYVQREQNLLSQSRILECVDKGTVVIEPFHAANLSAASYDVTLGKYYFRESPPEPGMGVYNPYSSEMVQRVWGNPLEAERAGDWMKKTGKKLDNIAEEDRIIWLGPGETIIGHTIEWIGGRNNVTAMMQARNSMARNFIEVCKCSGWGDIGYISRWTMEITNNSRHYSIPLVVGRRIAQIIFFGTDETVGKAGSYADRSYTQGKDLEEIKAQWTPLDCLPKMYKDREIAAGPVADSFEPAAGAWAHSSLVSKEYKEKSNRKRLQEEKQIVEKLKSAGKKEQQQLSFVMQQKQDYPVPRKRAKFDKPVDFDQVIWALC
eukprot:gb/GEZN01007283.1/.p1 GENE.gb/GEZN01007283.1/~~gb/GEZN01007283.1/.p1  ORF type:complete len:333 (+),score=60.79 gb/GEZN01007283.1/:215-1213(+)